MYIEKMLDQNKKNFRQFIILIGLGVLMPLWANATPATIPPVKPALLATPQNPINESIVSSKKQTQLQTTTEKLRSTVPLLPPDIQRIITRGKLLVSMPKKDNPPFFAVNEKGEYWGLDVELARDFAKQLGVSVVFDRQPDSYNAAVDEVVQRKTDVAICKLSRTFERAMRVRYSTPYIVLRHALLINRVGLAKQSNGNIPIEETVQKLHGNIGVISKSAYQEYASKYFHDAKVISYDTWEQVVVAATKGEVIAAYRDELEVKKIIRGNPGAALHFKTAVINDTTDFIAMAVAWDNTTLLALLNIFLENRHLDLTADKVLDRYSRELFKK